MTHAKTARRPTAAERRVSERIAAVMALITLAAAVVLLLVGTVRNWAGILMALAGTLVAVMAGWYVVSRRGAAPHQDRASDRGSGGLRGRAGGASSPDHEPQVRRGQGRAIPPGGRVPGTRNRADRSAAGR